VMRSLVAAAVFGRFYLACMYVNVDLYISAVSVWTLMATQEQPGNPTIHQQLVRMKTTKTRTSVLIIIRAISKTCTLQFEGNTYHSTCLLA
jgi:hypothetical protein